MLDCSSNQLTDVPASLSQMSALEQLYLRHNKLRLLPRLHSAALQVPAARPPVLSVLPLCSSPLAFLCIPCTYTRPVLLSRPNMHSPTMPEHASSAVLAGEAGRARARLRFLQPSTQALWGILLGRGVGSWRVAWVAGAGSWGVGRGAGAGSWRGRALPFSRCSQMFLVQAEGPSAPVGACRIFTWGATRSSGWSRSSCPL